MLEFVDSDLYFVQDKNNVINPLLQVGSGSVEKRTGSGRPKITGSSSLQFSTEACKELIKGIPDYNQVLKSTFRGPHSLTAPALGGSGWSDVTVGPSTGVPPGTV